MLELLASSFIMFGNPSIWAPNSFTWISPSDSPGDEQLYEPLLGIPETESE